MNFEFPIEEIKFYFTCHGTGKIKISCNKQPLENFIISGEDLAQSNNILIDFTKEDPADQDSFATLDSVMINGFECKEQFKTLSYRINDIHAVDDSIINNNLYFGYIGSMSCDIIHKNDLLTKAAYTIADKEFEYVKWPLRQGPHYREKTLANVARDTKFMYMGSQAPKTPEIVQAIGDYQIKDFIFPTKMDECKRDIEEWINNSTRVQFKNFDKMEHFTFSNGVNPCLDSFAKRSTKLYMPQKAYYMYRYFGLYDYKIKNLFEDELQPNSHVIVELPTLYYTNKQIIDKIIEAKQKHCTVALDLTWLPITVEHINIDLELIDEIYLSMNKTWPTDDIRPAWRWSKTKIKDLITFENEVQIYQKIPANLFTFLIKKFSFDYVYDRYVNDLKELREMFDLTQSPILWFTQHPSVEHNPDPIFTAYYMDEYVCVRKLLDYKNKHWW